MKHIDPHCHCRDGAEEYKTNIREVSELAKEQGMVAIMDMAKVFTEKEATERIALALRREPVVPYFIYLMLTAEEEQISEAVKVVNKYPWAVGLKLSTSTSSFAGVPRRQDQKRIFRTLARLGYRGVLAAHCQRADRLRPKLWNPREPWTHYLAQPWQAETASIADMVIFAVRSHFAGHLHICHISCHNSVRLVLGAKKMMKISCGVTPHHVRWSFEKMKEPAGLFYKCDPPLASAKEVCLLRQDLMASRIDWIESDFAPHTNVEKMDPPYFSGIADYSLYQELLGWLRRQGTGEDVIESLTYWNIKRVFGDKLKGV